MTELMDEAARIGDRIVREALRSGEACTWDVVEHDPVRGPTATRSERAGDSLYKGVSGIALFLGELWGVTGDRALLACARRALEHAVLLRRPPSPTLYTGKVGVALAAARLAEITGEEEWRLIVARQLEGLHDHVATCPDDVITGAAGGVLGLLRIERMTRLPGLRELAVRLGAHLEERARRSPAGWSWRSAVGTTTQDLTGYAHGAAGVAHAFLELYAATGDARWRFAASRAMAYERRHAIHATGDWPDFRTAEMMRAIPAGLPALRARLRAGDPVRTTVKPGIARAWCHGAPGIALTLARALHLGVDDSETRPELRRALATTRESLSRSAYNSHCLCHGAFGNAESLLVARDRLGIDDAGVVDATLAMVESSFGRAGREWVSGVMGGARDPSLMVGDAGIGHFLLRLVKPDIPSVLCLSDWNLPPSGVRDGDTAFREAELGVHLPRTLGALRRIPGAMPLKERVVAMAESHDDLPAVVAAVREMVAADTSPAGDTLRDALAVDAALLDEKAAHTDFVAQYCQELMRPMADEVDLDSVSLALSPHVRVLRTRRASSEPRDDGADAADEGEECFLVHRSADEVQLKQINALHAVILSALEEPASLQEMEAMVMESIDPDPSLAPSMTSYLRSIVREALEAGFVHVVAPVPS